MKFLFVFLNFLYFTCLSISAQDSKENIFNSIKENYQSKAFDCCILSSEGKWYFVTAVGNQKRSSFWGQLAGYYPKQMPLSDHAIKQKAREQVINFFVGKSTKKYINHTRLPKNMENLEDLEAVYERLHKSKKCFYSMPLIGSAGTDIYFFAKAITDEAISQGEDTQERTNSSSFNIAARDTSTSKSSSVDSPNSSNSKDNASDTQASENKSVTLVVSGSGTNKDEATKNALRAALEQTYGTFVSSNTQLVNDELVKDEIISVSSGNIEKYSEVSTETLKDGSISVCLQATVSIGKLVKFAQSKGASAELAGSSVVMNVKILKLQKKNELAAISNLLKELETIASNGVFDFKLNASTPTYNNGKYTVGITVSLYPNQNYILYYKRLAEVLKALSLSEVEAKHYNSLGLQTYYYRFYEDQLAIDTIRNSDLNNYLIFRNSDLNDGINLRDSLVKHQLIALTNFKVTDNIGTELLGYRFSNWKRIEIVKWGNEEKRYTFPQKLSKFIFLPLSNPLLKRDEYARPSKDEYYKEILKKQSSKPIFDALPLQGKELFTCHYEIIYSEEDMSKHKGFEVSYCPVGLEYANKQPKTAFEIEEKYRL